MLLLLLTGRAFGQDIREPVVRFSHPELDRVNKFVEARQYKTAIDLSVTLAERMLSEFSWEGYIAFMLRAAEVETFEVWKGKGFHNVELLPDYRRPLNYLHRLNRQAGDHLDDYPYLKANVLFTNAVVYGWLDMSDTAEVLHNEALRLRKRIYGPESREVGDSYLWRGILYNTGLQRKDLAEYNYRKAREIQKNFMPASRYALGSVYYGLATIARENYQFDEALALARYYLALYEDIPYEQSFGLQLIANVYWSQGNYEEAMAYRRKALDIYERSDFKEDLIMEYSNLSTDLVNLKHHEEAEVVLKKGEAILNTMEAVDPYYAKMLYENYGDLYRAQGRFDEAAAYFDKALKIAVMQYGESNDEVADIYRMRGQLQADKGLFEDALKDYQKMLNAVIPGFAARGYEQVPDVQYESPYTESIIAANFCKGDAFLGWFGKSGFEAHLEAALANYRAAYNQIIVARQTIGDELSKPFLMSNFEGSVENSIRCAHLMLRLSGDRKFADDILFFVELTKYLNVLDALKRAERATNSEIPVELLFELEGVRSKLNALQRQEWQQKHLALSGDSMTSLRDEILNLIDKRRELMTSIAGYSDDQVVPDNIASLQEIQKQLRSEEQLLEFFWGRDSVYTISLTRTSVDVNVTSNDGEMDSLLSAIHRIMEGKRNYSKAHIERYGRICSRVYERLFKPLVRKKKIIVVPDGQLNLIPVEALVVSPPPAEPTFKNLNYVIHDHQVSYAYSANILFHKPGGSTAPIKSVLAFSYTGGPGESDVYRQDTMASLPGTYRELETLSGVFDKVVPFIGQEATKTNFINYVENHDLIHLGIHGVGDPVVVDNSRLIFKGDSLGPGEIYAHDIYNLDIDARLVVLSACETGLGKRQTGEGIFSIARAFIYAGCPSVVMSMWRAADAFTASIMDRFYRRLQQGHSIGSALRDSKLQFLEESDELTAHPANWAAFVLNGKEQSFKRESTPVATWLVVMAAGAILLLLFPGLKRTLAARRARG